MFSINLPLVGAHFCSRSQMCSGHQFHLLSDQLARDFSNCLDKILASLPQTIVRNGVSGFLRNQDMGV